MNASNKNFSLSLTKFLQPLNLAIFITLSLFNLLAVPALHLLSLFLAHQPPPPWKSQITHIEKHHLVFGINFPIHSVSLTSLVSIHLLIHLSTHLSHHPSLIHSFTTGSKPTFSTNPFHLRLLYFLYILDCLTITRLDRTYHSHHFIFSLTFLISCLFRVVD